MSRQLEQGRELRQQKLDREVLFALETGVQDALSHAGADLVGLAVKFNGGDVLMTVKVVLAGRRQIAFVGAEDWPGAIRKLCREANADKLTWRADKYHKD